MPFFSIFAVAFILISVFLVPYFYTVDPTHFDSTSILLPPSQSHLFGTDRLGRDLLSRVIEAAKVSLLIGFASSFIATMIGVIYGISAALFRGGYDKIFVVVVDLFLTFPTLFLLLALVSYINASVWVLILIISITGWMSTARIVRSLSYEISSKSYIKILHIAKVSKLKIMLKYYTPLLAPIVLVGFTFGVSGAILAESALSFLGLGITPPQFSWGSILSDGKEVIDIAWWVSFFPGLLIFIITLSLINISSFLQNRLTKKDIQKP